MDLVLKNGRLRGVDGTVDMGIENGYIKEIGQGLEGKETYDCQGNIIVPGFIDLHTHMDKTHLSHITEGTTLIAAIEAFFDYCGKGLTLDDFICRGEKMLEQCIINGTSRIRTHILVGGDAKMLGLEAAEFLKKKYADYIDIEIIAMMSGMTLTPEEVLYLREAAAYDITGYGGAPHLIENPEAVVDAIIDVALEKGKILDLHVDEADAPDVSCLEYFAKRVKELGIGKTTTVGHITALSAVSEEKAAEIIELLKEAEINVVTLPSCNLFLMGREDKGLIRRGTTRINELLEAGVNTSLASDNIRDPFRPFGNGDLLEEALLTAQITRKANTQGLEETMDMITYNPAKACGLTDYGVETGCKANLVVLEAESISQSILSQSTKKAIIHNGRIVVTNEIKTTCSWKEQ